MKENDFDIWGTLFVLMMWIGFPILILVIEVIVGIHKGYW